MNFTYFRPLRAPDGAPAATAEPQAQAEPVAPPLVDEPIFELPPGFALAPDAPAQAQPAADFEARFRALEAENAQLKARPDSSAALAEALGTFKTGLEAIAARPVEVKTQAQPGPVVDLEAEDRSIDENFLDGPVKNVKKLLGREVAPAIETLVQSNVSTARAVVSARPREAALFARFGKEIEAEFDALPATRFRDPVAAYERAISVVRGRHFDELLSEAQSAQVPAAAAPAAEPAAPVKPAGVQSRALPGSPQAAAQARDQAAAGQKPITKSEMAWMLQYQRNMGQITNDQQFETVLELHRSGQLM